MTRILDVFLVSLAVCASTANAGSIVRKRPLRERSWDTRTLANDATTFQGIRIPHARRAVVSDDQYPDFNVLHHLTGISPYFDSPGIGLQPEAPEGCNVTAAAYLIRHSDIYANDFDYEDYISPFLQKLGNITDKSIFANYSPLAFLTTWKSPISESQVEALTPLGADDATAFGALVKKRYGFLSGSNSNFSVWTATAGRVVNTTQAFVKGFGNANIVQVDEGKNASANSLAPHESCPNFDGAKGADQSAAFRKLYAQEPLDRFKAAIPSLNFTDKDVFAMQELCGYETVIKNSSDFCKQGLFTPTDWLGFEYAQDIMYAYSLGYGLDFSPELGMPWLKASTDLITSNTSLPQNLFLSFTHREEPAFAMTALGLFNDTYFTGGNVSQFLPTNSINFDRQWKTSDILPFLGHVTLERLSCPSTTPSGDFVRVLVNSAPIPLPNPNGASGGNSQLTSGPGDSAPLQAFIDFVNTRAQSFGDFVGKCGVTADNGTNSLQVYQHTLGLNTSANDASSNSSSSSAAKKKSGSNGQSNGAAASAIQSGSSAIALGAVVLTLFTMF